MKKFLSHGILLCAINLVIMSFQPSVFAAKVDGLNEAMMGSVLSTHGNDYDVRRETNFSPEHSQIIWFASFKGYAGAPAANLSAEWVDPAGTVYKKQEFSTIDGNSRFAYTQLNLNYEDKQVLDQKGEWMIRVFWDGEPIDARKFLVGDTKSNFGKKIRIMDTSKVIYEGPIQTEPILSDVKSSPIGNLTIEGQSDSPKAVAVLVYPYRLDYSQSSYYDSDRGKFMTHDLQQLGFRTISIEKKKTIADQYRYLLRYDLDKKRFEINYFGTDMERLADFSEQSALVNGPLNATGFFPYDLSFSIADKIVSRFKNNNYRVLNLTPSRSELNGKSIKDIQALVHEKYGIDQIMFVPITAYTKCVERSKTSVISHIGLILCYNVMIFENGKPAPTFTHFENLSIGDITHGFLGIKNEKIVVDRFMFYSEDSSEDRKLHPDRPIKFYKDGVIDDTFAATKILERFEGKVSPGEADSDKGSLFNKLQGAGFLTKSEQ